MDSEDYANSDQELAKIRELVPGLIFAFYSGLLDKGFTEEKAMVLTQAYVHGLAGGKYKS